MPNPQRASQDLMVLMEHARSETAHRHGNYLDVEHLLLGLARTHTGPAYDLLTRHSVDPQALYDRIAGAVGMERPQPAEVKGYSKWARATLQCAADEAQALDQSVLSSGHLLLGLMGEQEGAVADVLGTLPFDAGTLRAELRERGEEAPVAQADNVIPMPSQPGSSSRQTGSTGKAARVVPFQRGRARGRQQQQQETDATTPPWTNKALIAGGVALLLAYLILILPGSTAFTLVFVVGGWVFSLTLHEFSHALVAYFGGDHTVQEKGYLTFNPLKYTHPLLSIGLPLLFLAMGGIGLPGGAVYIETHRLRNKWWRSAVSAAGPASNLVLALLLALPFLLGKVSTQVIGFQLYYNQPHTGGIWEDPTLWSAVAFLATLQVTAVFFNLLPIPPLDGFGIIEPLLDRTTANQLRAFGMYGILLIFVALWFIDPLNEAFWDMVYSVSDDLDIPRWLISEGYNNFQFWRTE